MSNPYRGEVELSVDGTTYAMRLSLGALMQLEQALQASSLVALIERFEQGKFTSADLVEVLLAGLNGGGWSGDRDALMRANLSGGFLEWAQAAGRLLALSFHVPD